MTELLMNIDLNNAPHIVSRITAARVVAKINNGCKHFVIDVRDEDRERLHVDIPDFTAGMFATQVTTQIVKLLLRTSLKTRLESITTTLPHGHLRLEGQLVD